MDKTDKATDIALVSFEKLKRAARKILSNTKNESDRQLAKFQASNVRKREAKKKR
jgi:hypothetical protein